MQQQQLKQNKRTVTAQSAIKKNIKYGIKCSNCHLLIHKKCSSLNQREILALKKVSLSGNVQLA